MLGPGNPNAAIASMFGTPKGFPPIWKRTKFEEDTRQSKCHQQTDSARLYRRAPFSGLELLRAHSGAALEEALLLADFLQQRLLAPAATKL